MARRAGVSRPAVWRWQRRFAELGVDGLLREKPRIPGKPPLPRETVERLLSKHPHINVIKEAGGDCDRVADLKLAMGDDLVIFSGDDSLTLPFMSNGASGVISVASNLVVEDLVKMVAAALRNDFDAAREIHLRYFKLFRALFLEPNPVPIKGALQRAGVIRTADVRSPLSRLSEQTTAVLFAEMDNLGL